MKNVTAYLLLSVGYLLVFAAFHKGGKFALRPWRTLQIL